MINLRFYGLIDPDHTDPSHFFTYAQDLVKGGITLIQYRDKKGSTRECIARARLLKEALHDSKVPLIINDRTDICLAAQADGVHLGQGDMDPQDARALLGPDAFIGLTVKQKDHLENSALSALSYISIGAVFPTSSKENAKSIGLTGLKDLLTHIRATAPHLPVCAIAGINEQTLNAVCRTGVDGVAVLSALSKSSHVVENARALRSAIDHSLPLHTLSRSLTFTDLQEN